MQPRVAWFTPLPPVRSGISQYSAELLPRLASDYRIDVFVDGQAGSRANLPVFSAHDFVWKHVLQPYDLIVYQVGNAPCHDYMWAYLVRYPGMVVLHDGQLHHARARSLLQQKRDDDYRTEFRVNHPGANVDVAEFGVAGVLGASTYLWPMRRIVVDSARLVLVHNEWLASRIREERPEARVRVVEMAVPPRADRPGARETVRRRHDIQNDTVLFAAFGRVTPEKRISPLIRALAAIVDTVPAARLLLVGETVGYYDPDAEARALGVRDRVSIVGFVPDEEMGDYLAAADVCVCLRWPTSRETSASWLRCLAAARPTIVTELVHTVDIPALDLHTWSVKYSPLSAHNQGAEEIPTGPACISIDVLDEERSLRLAMRRLATDMRLREILGRNAFQLWTDRFAMDRMVAGYRAALEAARAARPNALVRLELPDHLLVDGTEHATRLLLEMGLPEQRVSEIWGASARTSKTRN